MSNRTIESNKAIAAAWENEKQLVSEEKGTRDWTTEQQQDILDYGKAYDENGRAFRGHHMRSVSICPEEQGNPENIQLLSHEEHIEAHIICWQPTNWYYNPVTKERIEFGDGPIVPCKVIELSKPIVKIEKMSELQPKRESQPLKIEEQKSSGIDPPITEDVHDFQVVTKKKKTIYNARKSGKIGAFFKKTGHGVTKGAKDAVSFCVEHKEEISTALLLVGSILKAVTDLNSNDSVSENLNSSKSYHDTTSTSGKTSYGCNNEKTDAFIGVGSSLSERQSPREHGVSGYTRHWNGKEIHVDPYRRGGRKTDK